MCIRDRHNLWDSVRGFGSASAGNNLQSDTTGQQNQYGTYGYISSVTSTTTVMSSGTTSDAYVNKSGDRMIAWCWRAGGAPSADGKAMVDGVETTTAALKTAASAIITPTRMSVNTESGFSVVKWQAPDNTSLINPSIPHGLNQTPDFIIIKSLDDGTQNWMIWHNSLSNSAADYLQFQPSAKLTAGINIWGGSGPSNNLINFASQSNLGSNNYSNNNHIAYCWHSVPGYSAFGLYAGNGDNDNDDDPDPPFIYTGFTPAMVWIKSISQINRWYVFDNARSPHNENDNPLSQNEATVESSVSTSGYKEIDLLSNGFKIRNDRDQINASGHSYLYCAWATQSTNFTTAR